MKTEKIIKKVEVMALRDIIHAGKLYFKKEDVFEVEKYQDIYFLINKSVNKPFCPSLWIEEIKK